MNEELMFDQEKNRELKDAFLSHLPERIANFQNEWQGLCKGEWNLSKLEQLFQKIQELSGTSGRFGLIQVSESAFSLEVYLSSFLENSSCPKVEHIEKSLELFNLLSQAVKTAKPQESILNHDTKSVFFLRASDNIAPGLVAALEANSCSILTFSDVNDTVGELSKRLPDILIIDGEFLPLIGELSRVLTAEKEEHDKQVAIICISQTRSLEQRLRALRIGVDAYYLPPVDIREIVEKTIELTAPKSDHYRILVVEDDPAQAKFATSVLEKGGMKTLSITEPLKVLDALDEFRPDLILMDLYMPNASGTELTAIIREHPDFVATPVVFLSGEQDADKKLEALSTGGDDFLTKPIRPRHLINTITNRVHRARSLVGQGPKQGLRDPVSGLFHRRYFFQQLDNVIARNQSQPITGAILYLTIPNLNEVDEHTEGGEKATLIAALGTLISAQLEEQDIAARVDDENFAILAIRPHDKNIRSMAEKLAQTINNYSLPGGDNNHLTSHIGIAPFSSDSSDAAGMLTKAAKAVNRLDRQSSGIAHHNTNVSEEKQGDQLQSQIKDAWEKQSIQVLYQPLNNESNPLLEQYHVSLRLLTTRGTVIPESEFYTAATEAGLMVSINQWLLGHVLNSLAEKRSEGRQASFFIGQTISTAEQQNSCLSWLTGQLRSRQMVGSGLVFQYRIAELGSDIKSSKRFLTKLQELGIQISLSRFGANKAALTVLQYLKADFACLAEPLLKANPETAERVAAQIHQAGAKVIIPIPKNLTVLPNHWIKQADLIPTKS
ncbi:MAG: response regulator [Candidatus Sedimenticola sp. (ex Thyasira tokunagai)]